ncbi:helix-turn-helix transcriptional regulator [Natronolimnohabitans innermongolicus]|uniref:HTH iclR-type domain-containing protein n=1 Tax=Natronolimnohabitans innermongolicus JCM 12255 TaxID=1227499 RepID=L9WW41_9EURY|nr:hypothetical protein [Natronolimnohabitans innermongolicus]ELY53627.1 hypothetical protein C493_13963 [Natronolimnohabitans innermongolicus JCM 12255]
MRLSTAVAFALTILLVVATVGTVAIAPASAASASADAPSLSSQSDATTHHSASASLSHTTYEPDPADTWQEFHLEVTPSGDVHWTIESRFLVDDDETDEFEAYADAVADGERIDGYDIEDFETFRVAAEDATDREMTFEDAHWEDVHFESLEGEDQQLATISYTFTWTNFASVDGERIAFGDAFVTDEESGDVWFPTLEDGQRLVIEAPSSFAFDSTPRGASDGTISYDGPATLEADDYQIVFLYNDDEGGGGGEPGSDGELFVSATEALLAFGAFVVLIVTVSLAISRYQRGDWPFDAIRDEIDGDGPAATASTDGSGTGFVDDPRRSGVEHEFDETEAVDDDDAEDDVDVELLSDEERVKRLLTQNGGRMKQAAIVNETGWSDAKVSQLLSEMDDDDEIEKLRIGRENLITLPDVDPTEVQ